MQALGNLPWLIAATAVVMAGLLTFVATGLRSNLFSRGKIELGVALEALRAMKWRKYAHHVVTMLEKRGLVIDEQDRQPGEGGVDIMMRRGNARYLVQCKHSSGFHLTPSGIDELAKLVHMQSAAGAILVNAGSVDPAALARASSKGIDVIEGPELWLQMEPCLPFDIVEHIHAETAVKRTAKKKSALATAALIGLLAGVSVIFLLRPGIRDQSTMMPPVVSSASAPTQTELVAGDNQSQLGRSDAASVGSLNADATSSSNTPASALTSSAPAAMPDPTLTESQLASRRSQAESAVKSLTGVRSAAWSTRSTMVLLLPRPQDEATSTLKAEVSELAPGDETVAAADPLSGVVQPICDELTRYEELRFTRLQIQFADPRNEDDSRVRWRQCR